LSKKSMVAMNDEALTREAVIKIATETALKCLAKEKNKDTKVKRDKRLKNTRLLLENYTMLHDYSDKAVVDLKTALQREAGESLSLLWAIEQCDGDKLIESLKRSVTLTKTIMSHVDEMLRVYKNYCDHSREVEEQRRYRVLENRYVKNMSPKEICEKEGISQATYYRDNQESIRVLQVLVFGLEGLLA
jgi:hypothetical protein